MDESGLGFPKASRLRKRRQYLGIYAQGEKVSRATLVLYVSPSRQRRPRLGVTVSRKVGNATTRNRVKRLLREIFRQQAAHFRSFSDLVVNVKRSASEATYDELEADLLSAVKQWSQRSDRG